ncbi:MAG: GntR family transcriptional regulator [Deltaproteobacteria bacterium]|nr:GntR family transcriptional regulator [Deltaproteobacteria bacterium]
MSSIISTRVTKELEAAILSGQLMPRERLIEMDLISRFGGSRTVIREALKRLEAKGLVRTTPYRGAMVADLTLEEIEEIYFIRAIIEKAAARLVLKNIRPFEIQGLKKTLKEVERHLRRKTDQMIEQDGEFHRAIFKTCRNQYLYNMIDFLRTKAHIVAYNAWSLPQRLEQSIQEHRKIIQAIEERKRGQLEKLIIKHLTFSKNSYLAQLKGNDRGSFSKKTPRAQKRKSRD